MFKDAWSEGNLKIECRGKMHVYCVFLKSLRLSYHRLSYKVVKTLPTEENELGWAYKVTSNNSEITFTLSTTKNILGWACKITGIDDERKNINLVIKDAN